MKQLKQLKQLKRVKQLKQVKRLGARHFSALKGESRVAMSGHFRHATMFAHRSPAANGILNDMDEKNEMDDMEVLDSCEVSKVSKVAKFGMPDPESQKLPSLIRRGGRRFGGPGGRRFRVPALAGREN